MNEDQIKAVKKHARIAFGTNEQINQWMKTPNSELQGKAPVEAPQSDVMKTINKMVYGKEA